MENFVSFQGVLCTQSVHCSLRYFPRLCKPQIINDWICKLLLLC